MQNNLNVHTSLQRFFESSGSNQDFTDTREEILTILQSYNIINTTIPSWEPAKNCDIIVEGNISLKKFCREHYNISPKFYASDDFFYRCLGMGGKAIYYGKDTQYGFYICLFHEIAHSISHKDSRNIYKRYENEELGYDIGSLLCEKLAWKKAIQMANEFIKKYNINILQEFQSTQELHAFIDTFLVTYMQYKLATYSKDIFFTL